MVKSEEKLEKYTLSENNLNNSPTKSLNKPLSKEEMDNPQEFEMDMEIEKPQEFKGAADIKPSTPLTCFEKREKVEEEKDYEKSSHLDAKSDNEIVLALDPVKKNSKTVQQKLKEKYIDRLLQMTRSMQKSNKCIGK